MRVSLVLEPPATLAVLSWINSLQSVSIRLFLIFLFRDVRLELSELAREVLLGLVPQLGGLLQRV